MAKHDENKDLRLFSRIGKVNIVSKTLKASKAQIIGIRMWGRIDYLTHYCGYSFIWDNSAGVGISTTDTNIIPNRNNIKKDKKEHQLTNKTKRNKRLEA